MLLDNLQPLILFAVSAAFTPGPNNMMVTASGANFGYWRTLPHLLGITFGFSAMFVAIGLGLMHVFEAYPALHQALRYLGAAYMLYLAWRIATAQALGKSDKKGRPLTMLEAALFQWINPKALVFAVSALATFTTPGGDLLREILIIATIFLAISFSSASTWCLFGVAIGRLLTSKARLRIFNISMALLLAASVALIFSG